MQQKEVTYPKQDKAELEQMAEFYAKQYGAVYFVNCLNCGRTIAVEVPKINGNTGRSMQIFGYQDLFKTTRERLDKNSAGKKMVGYQCACGNDTRLAAVERGTVPTSTVVKDGKGNIVGQDGPIRISLSPFEREQMRLKVAAKQAEAKKKADYELNGNVERFETFEVVRVR